MIIVNSFWVLKYISENNYIIQNLNDFNDFKKIEEIVEHLVLLFNKFTSWGKCQSISLEWYATEFEISILQANIFLMARVSVWDFWRNVRLQKFYNIKNCYEYIHFCSGCIYLCESAFSFINRFIFPSTLIFYSPVNLLIHLAHLIALSSLHFMSSNQFGFV